MKKLLVAFVFTLTLFSCSKTVYVPVESIRYENRELVKRDSIYLRDSIFTQLKGDTVFIEKYRYLYRDHLIHDSIFITDSIQVPYPVEKIVYKTKYSLMDRITLVVVLGIILIFITIYFRTK